MSENLHNLLRRGVDNSFGSTDATKIGLGQFLAVLMNNTFRKLALSYSPARGKSHK
jgi:hypothetical protein